MADFFTFAWAAVANLVTLMSGIIALAIEGVRRWKNIETPNHWYAYLVIVCLFLGTFQAWREEHRKGEEASARVVNLQALLDAKGESVLQKELEATKAQLTELQKQLAPRRLKDEEKVSMANFLSSFGSFAVTVSSLPDAESSGYALDFFAVLKKAGWQVNGPLLAMNSEPMPGIWIITREHYEVPTSARIFMDMLKKHNVEARQQKQNDSSLSPDSFVFLVGSKP